MKGAFACDGYELWLTEQEPDRSRRWGINPSPRDAVLLPDERDGWLLLDMVATAPCGVTLLWARRKAEADATAEQPQQKSSRELRREKADQQAADEAAATKGTK